MNQSLKRTSRVAVVLAAGRGTRLRSELPKVLHPVGGRPMLDWVLEAATRAGCDRTLVVVGHLGDRVIETIGAERATWVRQEEQLGTGHALAQVADHISGDETLLVLSGDVPLVTAETLDGLASEAELGWGAMAVSRADEPGSLGRVVARDEAELVKIVEAADATAEELAIDLVNAGIYALPAASTLARLAEVRPDNAKGEIYLTDALTAAVEAGESVRLYPLPDPAEAFGVNDRADLARVHGAIQGRTRRRLLDAGVSLLDPGSVAVEAEISVGQDTVIHQDVSLLGTTRIGSGCVVHRGAWLRDVEIADGVEILPYTVAESCRILEGSRVGPFARLRPGTVIGSRSRIGNFVEIKNSTLAEEVKVGHLSYVGDAELGEDVNIGAGVVTCNYDGVRKHRTKVGARSFIGSDTMLVAPVEVGRDATTAAGSVVTRDVPDDALAVARGRQRNVEGWSKRRSVQADAKPTDSSASKESS